VHKHASPVRERGFSVAAGTHGDAMKSRLHLAGAAGAARGEVAESRA